MKKSAQLREIRESAVDELKGRLKRLEEELFGHRMKRYTNQLANTAAIRRTRREIARINTILALRAAGREEKAAATEKPVEEQP
jgi:large subunit ribosomal protein L29